MRKSVIAALSGAALAVAFATPALADTGQSGGQGQAGASGCVPMAAVEYQPATYTTVIDTPASDEEFYMETVVDTAAVEEVSHTDFKYQRLRLRGPVDEYRWTHKDAGNTTWYDLKYWKKTTATKKHVTTAAADAVTHQEKVVTAEAVEEVSHQEIDTPEVPAQAAINCVERIKDTIVCKAGVWVHDVYLDNIWDRKYTTPASAEECGFPAQTRDKVTIDCKGGTKDVVFTDHYSRAYSFNGSSKSWVANAEQWDGKDKRPATAQECPPAPDAGGDQVNEEPNEVPNGGPVEEPLDRVATPAAGPGVPPAPAAPTPNEQLSPPAAKPAEQLSPPATKPVEQLAPPATKPVEQLSPPAAKPVEQAAKAPVAKAAPATSAEVKSVGGEAAAATPVAATPAFTG